MPDWRHIRCGTVFSSKTPPFECGLCIAHGDPSMETGWECIGPSVNRPDPRAKKRRNGGRITAAKRAATYARDDHRCVVCGSPDDLTLDHIHPKRLGGTNAAVNLQTMCKPCNSLKGGKVLSPTEMRARFDIHRVKVDVEA